MSEGVAGGKPVGQTINAARLSLYLVAFACKSSRSRLPSGRDLTGTTLRPAITADYATVRNVIG